MVFVIATRAAYDEMRPRLDLAVDPVWVGNDVLSTAEIDAARTAGMRLTVFAHAIDRSDLVSELATVTEHHPGQIVWAESAA